MNKLEELPNIKDLKKQIIDDLIQRHGITKTAFFLKDIFSQKEDYLEIKENIFGKKTVEELFSETMEWKAAGKTNF